jgi:hypothetical protein
VSSCCANGQVEAVRRSAGAREEERDQREGKGVPVRAGAREEERDQRKGERVPVHAGIGELCWQARGTPSRNSSGLEAFRAGKK